MPTTWILSSEILFSCVYSDFFFWIKVHHLTEIYLLMIKYVESTIQTGTNYKIAFKSYRICSNVVYWKKLRIFNQFLFLLNIHSSFISSDLTYLFVLSVGSTACTLYIILNEPYTLYLDLITWDHQGELVDDIMCWNLGSTWFISFFFISFLLY